MKRLVLGLGLLLWGWAGCAQAQTYEDADAAYQAKDYAKAIAILEPLAAQGDRRAMNRIGYMYDFGQGYGKDVKMACDWYEKAAERGSTSAQGNLASCYEYGNGREKDMATALRWYTASAEKGNFSSQLHLNRYYFFQGDRAAAQKWGQMAVDGGHAMGRFAMWLFELPYTGPRASYYDIACVYVMNMKLGKSDDYCD